MSHLHVDQRVQEVYVCEALLGTGGMAEVWRVRYEPMGARFAMKVPAGSDSHVRAMFQREAQLMARLSHRNLVQLLDHGALDSGQPYIVMELVRGQSLLQILQSERRIPWRRAVLLVGHLLQGLGAMHAAGVVHRDIKPGNLLVTAGPPEGLKIIDLGVACERPPPRLLRAPPALLVGTAGYIDPEVLAGGHGDERADLYAVGAVLYAMIYGTSSRDPSTLAARHRGAQPMPALRVELPAAPGPELPPALLAWMQALLSDRPAERPKSCAEASALLTRAAALAERSS